MAIATRSTSGLVAGRADTGVMVRPQPEQFGFTLLELIIVASILTIIASIGVPHYVGALRVARIGKAKHELVTISHAIDAHAASSNGRLPLTLYQVGFGGKLDPWGVPYCYLNYQDGTGDGLQWAIDAGIVDPGAFGSTDDGGSGGGGGGGLLDPLLPGGGGDGGGLLDPLKKGSFFAIPLPAPVRATPQGSLGGVLSGDTARATVNQLVTRLDRTLSPVEIESLVATLVAGGNFDFYTGVSTETTRRRDRYMFPLNTDYDLFSLGPDGRTAVSLGEKVAQDDVIRANNGGYYGSASAY